MYSPHMTIRRVPVLAHGTLRSSWRDAEWLYLSADVGHIYVDGMAGDDIRGDSRSI